uniref:Serine protease 54 n=1 Tax=Sciurus vulgaris TaxID=55149 RepID=A0A8D2DDY6_SCIVU
MDHRNIAHTEYPVNTIIIHEKFDNRSMSNNIALLRTDSAMHFNDLVQSICFLDRKLHKPPVLRNCWVSGWNPTSATGNHMTMSILRRISVKDIDLCPLHLLQKTGCGSHTQQETEAVCLGEPGSPMMCQLQQLDLWVLRGILTQGGDTCPGLFMYTRVEDYSDWIMSETRMDDHPLSSLRHWQDFIPHPYFEEHAAVTRNSYSEVSHTGWSQTSFQEQSSSASTVTSQMTNSTRDGLDFREKGLRESGRSSEAALQPMYYDYYGGEAGEGGSFAGQNRLHQPQEIILVFFVLVFFGSGV